MRTATTSSETKSEERVLLMTSEDVARRLRVSKASLWRMRSTGKLPPPIHIGGIVRWRAEDVEKWVKDGCPELARPK